MRAGPRAWMQGGGPWHSLIVEVIRLLLPSGTSAVLGRCPACPQCPACEVSCPSAPVCADCADPQLPIVVVFVFGGAGLFLVFVGIIIGYLIGQGIAVRSREAQRLRAAEQVSLARRHAGVR